MAKVYGMHGVEFEVMRETAEAYVLYNAELGKVQVGSHGIGVAVTSVAPDAVIIALDIAQAGVMDFEDRVIAFIEDVFYMSEA